MKNRPLISIVVVNENGDRSTAKIKGDGCTPDMVKAAYDAIAVMSGQTPTCGIKPAQSGTPCILDRGHGYRHSNGKQTWTTR